LHRIAASLFLPLKGLVGISPEVDRICEPKDLDHLAQMLEKYGQTDPIARLTFWGVGEQKDNKVFLTFTDWQETLSGDDFLRLRQTHLDLSRAFAADAEVVFLTRIFFLKPPSLIYTALVRIAQPLGGERADVEAAIGL
jgi:hypothetical protein